MTEISGFDRRQFLGALSLGAAALALPHLVDAQTGERSAWRAFSPSALPR